MVVYLRNCEVRSSEKKVSKDGNEYGLLYCEELELNSRPVRIMFRNMDLENSITALRGVVCNLRCELEIASSFTRFELLEVLPCDS